MIFQGCSSGLGFGVPKCMGLSNTAHLYNLSERVCRPKSQPFMLKPDIGSNLNSRLSLRSLNEESPMLYIYIYIYIHI